MLSALKLPKTLTVEDPASIAAAALADPCTETNPRTPSATDLEAILRELAL